MRDVICGQRSGIDAAPSTTTATTDDGWRHLATAGDHGEELDPDVGVVEAVGMGAVVDLEQWRRAQRLLPILVDRHGLSFFLDDPVAFPSLPTLRLERLERCVAVAADWIEHRSGRSVDDDGRATLLVQLRGLLVERLRAGATVSRR